MPGTVAYEVAQRVATLTLDRPERLNAITPELADDVRAALARAEALGGAGGVRSAAN